MATKVLNGKVQTSQRIDDATQLPELGGPTSITSYNVSKQTFTERMINMIPNLYRPI